MHKLETFPIWNVGFKFHWGSRVISEIITIDSLSKNYGATVALSEASLSIREGEVHALLGENGAGKSTLVKILSGIVSPAAGEMMLGQRIYRPSSVVESRVQGVATAFQELSLIPRLTVGENLLLPEVSSRRFWPERHARIMQRASDILQEWEISDIPVNAIVEDLSLAQRQRIEITRALSHATRLLILDEPTAALPDVGWLFRQIKRITTQGVAVMYISHRLAEVRDISQRATILRNGSSIGTVELAGISDDEIFAMMVGHKPNHTHSQTQEIDSGGESVLELQNLTVGQVSHLNFTLKAGEIVGLAALEGQGQHDFFRALGGVTPIKSGSIKVNGEQVNMGSPRRALESGNGISFVPEERKTEGIFPNLSAATNIALANISAAGHFGLLNSKSEKTFAEDVAAEVELSKRYFDFNVEALSGGNQQKILLARALKTGAKCLVLFDPARGVDVGTKQAIYAMMRNFVKQGGAILFYSSELSELVQLSSRCIVMYDGKIVSDIARSELSEESLLSKAHGQRAHIANSERLAG